MEVLGYGARASAKPSPTRTRQPVVLTIPTASAAASSGAGSVATSAANSARGVDVEYVESPGVRSAASTGPRSLQHSSLTVGSAASSTTNAPDSSSHETAASIQSQSADADRSQNSSNQRLVSKPPPVPQAQLPFLAVSTRPPFGSPTPFSAQTAGGAQASGQSSLPNKRSALASGSTGVDSAQAARAAPLSNQTRGTLSNSNRPPPTPQSAAIRRPPSNASSTTSTGAAATTPARDPRPATSSGAADRSTRSAFGQRTNSNGRSAAGGASAVQRPRVRPARAAKSSSDESSEETASSSDSNA